MPSSLDARGAQSRSTSIVFFLMIRRPPRSTLFPYTDALPICLNFPPDHPARDDYDTFVTTEDRKSTRLNSSHQKISYAVFSGRTRRTEPLYVYCFFFNDTATTEIYTLSLHRRSSDLPQFSARSPGTR